MWLRPVSEVSRRDPFEATRAAARPANPSGLAKMGSRSLSDNSPLYELKLLESIAREGMILSY